MNPDEASQARREILDDVGALLDEHLAGGEWGRLLVEVVDGPTGDPVVAGIDVEEIIGDEARVDAVFGGEGMCAILPVLAKASQALCGLDGVDLEAVRGGTFIRRREGGFVWIPALVRTPSGPFDAERDALVGRLRAKNAAFGIPFGSPSVGGIDVDLNRETVTLETVHGSRIRARATLVGTFAPATRTWGWGFSNPHLPEQVRRACAATVDRIVDHRDMWELSTPVFATDEATAWAIAALVCDRAGGDAVCCGPDPEGSVFLLLRDAVRGDA
jgi:hypothetical protein